jgi:Mrp family chromosome partitioning ATPase
MSPLLQEPFHRLQTNLALLAQAQPLRSILVVSAAPGEGKSIVARNLSLAYRGAGRSVAVFDADFRHPDLGALMAAEEGPGLIDILAGRVSLGETIQEVQVPINGNGSHPPAPAATATASPPVSQGELAVVPAGLQGGDLTASLASGHFRGTLEAAVNAYDTVIVDSSPLLASADVLPLLSEVDGVLVVTRLGNSSMDSARRLLAAVRGAPNANLLGIVVNGVPPRLYRSRAYGSYYG